MIEVKVGERGPFGRDVSLTVDGDVNEVGNDLLIIIRGVYMVIAKDDVSLAKSIMDQIAEEIKNPDSPIFDFSGIRFSQEAVQS